MESIGRQITDWALAAAWSEDKQGAATVHVSGGNFSANASTWQDPWSSSSSWVSDLPHAWSADYREPIFTFTSWDGKEMGFYSMSVMYWAEMLLIMVCEAMVAVAFSFLVYKYIVRQPRSTTAFLLGFGVILPFWIFFPSLVVDWLGIRNKLYRFCMAAVTPTLCVFRTTEAMYGYTPEHAISSQRAFIVYFGSPMVAKYDKEKGSFVKATDAYLLEKSLLVVRSFVFLGALYSVFLMFPNIFPQFGIEYDEAEWYSLGHLFSPKNFKDSFLYTAIFQFTLATSGDGGNFVTSLITGYEMEPFMTNPMFESQTMAEFWGKRWNKLIQTLLKRGIFKPLRSILPKYVAMAGTFAVSGIFHEWLMMIIFAPLPQDIASQTCGQNQCYKLVYGSALVFFMYMGVLIAWEFLFLPKAQFKKSSLLYKFCMGIIATVGCPFFMAPYVHTTFFKDGFPGYFMVQPVE